MITMYNYNKKDSAFNDIIDEILFFAKCELEDAVVENREERLSNLNYAMAKYALAGSRFEASFEELGLEAMKNTNLKRDRVVCENFDAILAQVINSILPAVTNYDMVGLFADIHKIGYGDTARFVVKSNELYKVNEIAHGVQRGVLEPIYNEEITVNASPVQLAFEVDFYAMAAGYEDIADKAIRVARSFEQYLFTKVMTAINAATSKLGPAYSATGFSNTNWSTLASRIKAANGGNGEVMAIGTVNALNQIVPSQTGLQYGLGVEVAKKGYLDRFMGVKLLPMEQVFKYGEVNTNGQFALADDMIYFLSTDANARPIKIVYEGDSIYVEKDANQTSDRTYRAAVSYNVGVGIVLGNKFATLEL